MHLLTTSRRLAVVLRHLVRGQHRVGWRKAARHDAGGLRLEQKVLRLEQKALRLEKKMMPEVCLRSRFIAGEGRWRAFKLMRRGGPVDATRRSSSSDVWRRRVGPRRGGRVGLWFSTLTTGLYGTVGFVLENRKTRHMLVRHKNWNTRHNSGT